MNGGQLSILSGILVYSTDSQDKRDCVYENIVVSDSVLGELQLVVKHFLHVCFVLVVFLPIYLPEGSH